MTLDSTAGLRDRITAAEGKFEVGVGFLPRATEDQYNTAGTIIGGASIWITNLRPAEEQAALALAAGRYRSEDWNAGRRTAAAGPGEVERARSHIRV